MTSPTNVSYLTFVPDDTSTYQQQVVLDGEAYTLQITWSLFGARYYLNIYSQAGTLIVTRPLIGSPLGYDLASVASENNIVTATTSDPHTYTPGSVITLAISGCLPDEYNGTYQCNILNRNQFSYALVTTDTVATGLGQVRYFLSLTDGYFTSELVYFPDSQQLVVYG
jgi:hypothetical protein